MLECPEAPTAAWGPLWSQFLAQQGATPIDALPVPEIEALSLTKLHTSGDRRNM